LKVIVQMNVFMPKEKYFTDVFANTVSTSHSNRAPTPAPAVPDAPIITFESGLLNVKFSIANLPIWSFRSWNGANVHMPLLSHRHGVISR